MRKWLIILAIPYLVALHIIAVLAFFAPHLLPYQGWRLDLPSPEPTAYAEQRHRHIYWLDKHAQPGAIAFLGASHVEGLDPALFDRPILKYAAGGDTLRHALTRVPEYTGLAKASVIVTWLGYNDTMHRGAQEIADDKAKLLNALPMDVPIIMLSVAPANLAEKQDAISEINALYRPLCAAAPRCSYIELADALADSDGGLLAQYDRGDGIHLNAAGYAVMAAELQTALDASTSDEPNVERR